MLQLDLVELKWRTKRKAKRTTRASIGPCGIEIAGGVVLIPAGFMLQLDLVELKCRRGFPCRGRP